MQLGPYSWPIPRLWSARAAPSSTVLRNATKPPAFQPFAIWYCWRYTWSLRLRNSSVRATSTCLIVPFTLPLPDENRSRRIPLRGWDKPIQGLVRQSGRPSGGKNCNCEVAHGAGKHITREVVWGHGEYAIDWGPGYRIYLAKDGETLIILFGGGTKRGQQKDIDRAKVLHAEYKARKKVRSTSGRSEGQER